MLLNSPEKNEFKNFVQSRKILMLKPTSERKNWRHRSHGALLIGPPPTRRGSEGRSEGFFLQHLTVSPNRWENVAFHVLNFQSEIERLLGFSCSAFQNVRHIFLLFWRFRWYRGTKMQQMFEHNSSKSFSGRYLISSQTPHVLCMGNGGTRVAVGEKRW